MAQGPSVDARALAHWLVSAAVILTLLVVGRPLLAPLAFAILLWAILNALTDALVGWRLPRALAWGGSVLLIAAALYLVAQIVGNEADAVTAAAPAYLAKLQRLAQSFLTFLHLGRIASITDIISGSELAGVLGQVAASAGSFVFTLAMVVVYVGFLLAEQPHLPGKLERLQSDAARRDETGAVIHAIARQVQAYLGVCTFLSAIMALATYALLVAMQVNFAGFWALVLFLLTYIPTVGAAGVLLPATMALLQYGSFAPFLVVVIALGGLHFVLANIVSTVMLGRTLDMSPLAIILSLTFWGLVWGIAGLFLAVPLTGAFAIVCRHVENLRWVAVMLAGPEPRVRRSPARSKRSHA